MADIARPLIATQFTPICPTKNCRRPMLPDEKPGQDAADWVCPNCHARRPVEGATPSLRERRSLAVTPSADGHAAPASSAPAVASSRPAGSTASTALPPTSLAKPSSTGFLGALIAGLERVQQTLSDRIQKASDRRLDVARELAILRRARFAIEADPTETKRNPHGGGYGALGGAIRAYATAHNGHVDLMAIARQLVATGVRRDEATAIKGLRRRLRRAEIPEGRVHPLGPNTYEWIGPQ